MTFTYPYPRPIVTVDILLLRNGTNDDEVLLIQRKNPPFANMWALPGGFVDKNESLAEAAKRELHEETGISGLMLHQLHAFGDPGRDPRGHTITVVYGAILPAELQVKPTAADDAQKVGWFALKNLPPLAFDHAKIIPICTQILKQNFQQ
jgi:8-oxo-dGTP diphosphatase